MYYMWGMFRLCLDYVCMLFEVYVYDIHMMWGLVFVLHVEYLANGENQKTSCCAFSC